MTVPPTPVPPALEPPATVPPTPETPPRVAVVWCPDWPVVAAMTTESISAHLPVAVVEAGRVVACSQGARTDGVRRGMRRRQAQACCPDLVIVRHDPDRDARVFEPVVTAVEQVVAALEILRPGLCAFGARGPARHAASEAALAERVIDQVAAHSGAEAVVGLADGIFGAVLAARRGLVIPSGQTPDFLASLPIAELGQPELAALLRRLGIRTLGDFAALPERDVVARFGPGGALAHWRARGLDPRPLLPREAPPELAVGLDFDPPLERVDTAAFTARSLAEQLTTRLAGHGLACLRLVVEVVTADGAELTRVWRHEGVFTAGSVADRVRWQLDGWLSGRAGPDRPQAGITSLRLVPDDLVRGSGLQLGLWGQAGGAEERAYRALTRLQGMLDPEAVLTAVLGGGRDPISRVQLVPWGEESGEAPRTPPPPWPGRLPPPAPATVFAPPHPATVLAADGAPVGVTGRHLLSAPPTQVGLDGKPPRAVLAWAGPWPVDERWWDPATARRRARFQVVLGGGVDAARPTAALLALEGSQWWVEGVYD